MHGVQLTEKKKGESTDVCPILLFSIGGELFIVQTLLLPICVVYGSCWARAHLWCPPHSGKAEGVRVAIRLSCEFPLSNCSPLCRASRGSVSLHGKILHLEFH